MHNRLDGGREDDFGAEVGQFLGGPVGDVPDGTRGGDGLRVGGHDARHVGPDFHQTGLDARRQQRGGVVRTAAAQGGRASLLVRCNEARYDEKGRVGVLCKGFGNVGVGLGRFHATAYGLDDVTGVEPLAGQSQRREFGGQDLGGEQLSEALDGIQAGRTQLAQEKHPVQDALE